ncbi:MAG: thiamine biosynthesis protein ThiS [Anaerolineae bacterium]|nr:thiamine biosynthesis protein ThiS [Anaerolineae bacterium]MBT7189818.1 thiamine biosynthesis protein ThiS [Anaerolineae bacterium]MBT7988682.1 thiamine biosynthesis protein ThiS [Anaerolineae bacterium]
MKVKVEVRVFATLRKYLPELGIGEPKIVELPQGSTFEDLREMLGLPIEEIKIIMRNGIQTEMDEIIEDGDRIAYAPAVAGG